jgi:nucleoside-diphosphate-sugar epimerase
VTDTGVAGSVWSRRALVTGAAGFIGSHLVEALVERGSEVVALDRRPPAPRRTPSAVEGRTRSVVADLADGGIAGLLDGTDTVFHLAGVPGVRESWGDRFADYARSNISATHEVIRACEQAGVRRLVFASSSSVYGSAAGRSAEVDPTVPRSPYGATKLAAEHLCLAHARRVDTRLSVTVLRYFTVYGPRQRSDMAVHRILISALTGTPFELYGDGSQRREFTYVEDVVDATIAAAALPFTTSVINIGGGSSVEMTEVLALAAEITGRPLRIVHRDPRPGDVAATAADLTVARTVLGYRPMVDLREGMSRQAASVDAGLRSDRAAADHRNATTGATA